jgi:hypothetical protein
MNSSEWIEPALCNDCNATIWPEVDRSFACSPEMFLCFACAVRRGGSYDANHERWTAAPDVGGLLHDGGGE